jgi:hypothetical protein
VAEARPFCKVGAHPPTTRSSEPGTATPTHVLSTKKPLCTMYTNVTAACANQAARHPILSDTFRAARYLHQKSLKNHDLPHAMDCLLSGHKLVETSACSASWDGSCTGLRTAVTALQPTRVRQLCGISNALQASRSGRQA